MELDRTSYPSGAEVFVTISDVQLNQDPTDEDSWTFNVNSTATVFIKHTLNLVQIQVMAGAGLINLNPHLSSLDFEDNGQVTLDLDTIIELKTNSDQPDAFVYDGTNSFSQIVTFLETQPNSATFQL